MRGVERVESEVKYARADNHMRRSVLVSSSVGVGVGGSATDATAVSNGPSRYDGTATKLKIA